MRHISNKTATATVKKKISVSKSRSILNASLRFWSNSQNENWNAAVVRTRLSKLPMPQQNALRKGFAKTHFVALGSLSEMRSKKKFAKTRFFRSDFGCVF